MFWWLVVAVSEVVALCCCMGLWRSRVSIFRKLVWTLILLVPVLGAIFYGGMFEIPPVQSEGFRSTNEAPPDGWGH